MFAVAADGYDNFMGRYSRHLAPRLAAFAGVEAGMRVLDVGCGPGALTEVLARIVGPTAVAAADPSRRFVEACSARVPGADVREAGAEALPWEDASFDVALAQLVLNFVDDPAAGAGEMRRVVRPDGVVAACTWDQRGEMTMLRVFWDAASALDPSAPVEGGRTRFGSEDELRGLWREVGLVEIDVQPLDVTASYWNFDDFWLPFLGGVGPAGAYCASLTPDAQAKLREACRRGLGNPTSTFELSARAWAVRGRSPQ